MKNKYLLIVLLIIFGVSCSSLPNRRVPAEEKSILETDLEESSTDLLLDLTFCYTDELNLQFPTASRSLTGQGIPRRQYS